MGDTNIIVDDKTSLKVWHGATLVFESPHSADGRRHGLVRSFNDDGSLKRLEIWVDGTERPDVMNSRLAQVIIFGKCLT